MRRVSAEGAHHSDERAPPGNSARLGCEVGLGRTVRSTSPTSVCRVPDAEDEEFEADKQTVISGRNRTLRRIALLSVVALVVVAVEAIAYDLIWLLAIFVLFEVVWWVFMLRWHRTRNERFRQLERPPGPAGGLTEH